MWSSCSNSAVGKGDPAFEANNSEEMGGIVQSEDRARPTARQYKFLNES